MLQDARSSKLESLHQVLCNIFWDETLILLNKATGTTSARAHFSYLCMGCLGLQLPYGCRASQWKCRRPCSEPAAASRRSAGSLARASPQKALRRRKHRRELCQSSICGTVLEISSFTPPPQKGATVPLKNSITAHIHEDPLSETGGLLLWLLPSPPGSGPASTSVGASSGAAAPSGPGLLPAAAPTPRLGPCGGWDDPPSTPRARDHACIGTLMTVIWVTSRNSSPDSFSNFPARTRTCYVSGRDEIYGSLG